MKYILFTDAYIWMNRQSLFILKQIFFFWGGQKVECVIATRKNKMAASNAWNGSFS